MPITCSLDLTKPIKKQLEAKHIHSTPPFQELVSIDYSMADKKGEWKWGLKRDWTIDETHSQIIGSFFSNYHKCKKWSEVYHEKVDGCQKHIPYYITEICHDAYLRLVELKLDDFEQIFRFRLQGDYRFYGFTIGSNFMALWYDPYHGIYPYDKEKKPRRYKIRKGK